MRYLILFFALMTWGGMKAVAQYNYPFQNPDLPQEERIDDLLSRMTLEEKISQMMNDSPAVDRLGIPEYNWWNECLHGLAFSGYATVFPQSISIAASWNKNLIHDIASVISDEARAKHHEYIRRGQRGMCQGLDFWAPNVNIFRDPRWGRGHETYGEDPYLTGQMGKQFVLGLQGGDSDYFKVIATAKHYAVHSGPESLRHEFDATANERDLRETYLPAFRTLVKEAGVYSIMGAYNRYNGEACCANSELFRILRDEWGFDGYVVSDCGAIRDVWKYHKNTPDAASAAALAVKAGCDLECGTTYGSLNEAVERGLITESEIDVAVKRILRARFKLGMFDPDDRVDYAQIPFSVNDNPAHNNLSRDAARESIVLLKNENNVLPLSKSIKTVAVIGPNADDVQSLWGNYYGIPSHPVTILQGIRNKMDPKARILYTQGCPLSERVPRLEPIPSIYLETKDGEQGLHAEYFDNNNCEGKPLFTRIDDNINNNWDIGTPDPRLKMGAYSVRWSGYLVAPETGTYQLVAWGTPGFEITFEGDKKNGVENARHPWVKPLIVDMKKGKRYEFKAKYRNTHGYGIAELKWAIPNSNMLEKAVETAKKADVVILALGVNERIEAEGDDRTYIDLPKIQQELMEAIAETGKPVILVLINGGPLSVNWASENIPAILTAGYPGQEGGNAIADVLFGDYNPAGRLPITYYKSLDGLPPFGNYSMEGRTYRYFKGDPLYPFGFGLSYATFEYSNLEMPEKININEPVSVSVDVTNTGTLDGDEVVQLYITDEKATTTRPIRQLEGFERIYIKKGETRTVVFTLEPRQLSMIDKDNKRVTEPGWFTVSLGGKQPGFTGMADAHTTSTISGRFKVAGKTTMVE